MHNMMAFSDYEVENCKFQGNLPLNLAVMPHLLQAEFVKIGRM